MGCRFIEDTAKNANSTEKKDRKTNMANNNAPASYTVVVNGKPYHVDVVPAAAGAAPVVTNVQPAAAPVAAPVAAPAAAPAAPATGTEITAPMPGTVLRILVDVGQAVKKGDDILVLEAMKMEQALKATVDGTVAAINVSQGDTVEAGEVVAII